MAIEGASCEFKLEGARRIFSMEERRAACNSIHQSFASLVLCKTSARSLKFVDSLGPLQAPLSSPAVLFNGRDELYFHINEKLTSVMETKS